MVASVAGVIRTATGGYELAFVGSGLLCLLAAGLCLFMRRAGDGIRHAVAAGRAVGAAGGRRRRGGEAAKLQFPNFCVRKYGWGLEENPCQH